MNVKSAAELKAIARGKLLGNYSTIVAAILMVDLMIAGVHLLTEKTVDLYVLTGMVIYAAISFIVILISTVFTVGELGMYMELACGGTVKVTDIFAGFRRHPDKVITLGFMILIRCCVWVLPAAITYCFILFGGYEGDILILLLAGLLIIGIVGALYTYLRFSQCFYIILDYPDLSVKEIMDHSIKLMEGNYGRYLYMALSFIPLYLLCVLSLGIGLLFVGPYRGMTGTEFYLGLAKHTLFNNDDRMASYEPTLDIRT